MIAKIIELHGRTIVQCGQGPGSNSQHSTFNKCFQSWKIRVDLTLSLRKEAQDLGVEFSIEDSVN